MKVVFVFFLFVISMFSVMRSLYLKLKKSIPVFNVTVKQPLRNWSIINRVALLAICLLLINFSIVFGSGLHFQWYFALLVAQYICFLILDRFFIAVSYSKVNIKDLPGGKQLYIIIHTLIGYFYIVSRVLYFFLLIILFPYSLDLMGRPVESLILDGPFEKYDRKEQKMAKSQYLFGDAINIVARYEKYSFFDNELIVYDCINQAYFLERNIGCLWLP